MEVTQNGIGSLVAIEIVCSNPAMDRCEEVRSRLTFGFLSFLSCHPNRWEWIRAKRDSGSAETSCELRSLEAAELRS
jgi:hypothetical protein